MIKVIFQLPLQLLFTLVWDYFSVETLCGVSFGSLRAMQNCVIAFTWWIAGVVNHLFSQQVALYKS